MDTRENLKILTKQLVGKLGINWRLMAAIFEVESGWDNWAVRYESQFKYQNSPEIHAKVNRTSLATESNLQKCSWGLGQVMGCTARDLGYTGPLPQLCLPELGIKYACGHWLDRCADYLEIEDQISAYNAGYPKKENGVHINKAYIEKVLKVYRA